MKHAYYKVFIISVLALACMSDALAREPIQVDIVGSTSSAGFKSLEDMIDSFQLDPESTYGPGFDPTSDFGANVDILGFQMNLNIVGNELTLSFTNSEGTTVSHIINSAARASMFSQLEDFFKSKAGQSVFDEYVKAIQSQAIFNFVSGAQSPVGESVRENTMRAMGDSLTFTEMRSRSKDGSNFSIGYEYTDFENEYFSGESTTIPIQIGSRLNQTADIQFRIPITWTDLDGTEFYRFGLEFDLGIKLVGHRPQSPFEWEVTPTVGNYFLGTSDLMMGGDIYNYGIQNRLQWNSQSTSFSYGAYWGQYKSTNISWGDYNVDLQVDEEIISHGIKLAFRMGQSSVLDFYAILSRPQSGIGYREIQTIGATFNFRIGGMILQVGYAEDEGEDTANAKYKAERWLANLLFRF